MLPGALVTSVLVWRAFDSNRAATERRLLDSARVDALALDREFTSVIRILEALATSPDLDRDDLEAFYLEARRVQATQPGWFTVILGSLDEQQLLSTRYPWGTAMMAAAEPASLRILKATRRPVVGAIRPPQRGGPEHLFAIRVPVERGGQLRYTLSAVVNVESLVNVVPTQKSADEWTRTILDPAGTIAVRTRGAENYVGTPATDAFKARLVRAPESITREETQDGVPVYAATSRSAFGWTTVVVVRTSALDDPLRASTSAVLVGGALLMVCGLAAVLLVSRRLTSDLAAATAAAEAVAAGRPVPGSTAHVAETHRLQRALVLAAALLEKRAAERDEEIRRADAARTEAVDANQTKDRFLAVLGHELRNPLAPALTALEVMRARDPEVFTREREVLERQIAHLSRLVNDLLDVSRLARGQVQLKRRRFALREAVCRAVDMARPLITQREHVLDVAVPADGLPIDGDIDRIVQLLSNLVTNAAKYTPPGGRIRISAERVEAEVVIRCEDSGPGLPPGLMSTLFDPFAQGPRNIDRREGGLGLGLALARTFAEMHGGSIHVESRAGSGAIFVVTLPMADETSAVVTDAEPAEARTLDGHRVLVVDDNDDACEMLALALGSVGHQVAVAATGPEALEVARAFGPAVAVLDIGLPGMSGYELAAALRAEYPRIALIALTGYGRPSDVSQASAAGFDAHCTKPAAVETLLETIDRVLDRGQAATPGSPA